MLICNRCGKKAVYSIPGVFVWREAIKDYIINDIHLCVRCNVELGELLKDWLVEETKCK